MPFLSRAAPSDTCRVWKRGANVRADVSLAGFDGLRPRRAERSFVFLAAPEDPKLPIGSLLVLHHGRREVVQLILFAFDQQWFLAKPQIAVKKKVVLLIN